MQIGLPDAVVEEKKSLVKDYNVFSYLYDAAGNSY